MTRELIDKAMLRFAEEARNIYGEKLHRVILYGSCARNDYDDQSDIDIMVLLNVPKEQIKYERGKARTAANNLDKEFDFDVLLMPTVQSKDQFEEYGDALPLYANIRREGKDYAG